MRYKKIILLTIILSCLLSVSAVCAAENVTDDVVVEKTIENILSVENHDILEKNDFNENLSVENDSNLEKTDFNENLSVENDSNLEKTSMMKF